MTGHTHKLAGVCVAGAVVSTTLQAPFTLEKGLISIGFSIACIVGSLFPDIDIANSKIGHRVRLLSSSINKVFGHRGITHAPLIYLISGLMCLIATQKFLYGFWQVFAFYCIAGFTAGVFIAHLLLDSITKEGIPIFYPFFTRKIPLLPLRTGKCEPFIRGILIFATVTYIVVSRNPDFITNLK